jgi:adenosine deaminase
MPGWLGTRGRRTALVVVAVALLTVILGVLLALSDTALTAVRFHFLSGDQTALRSFLHRMPKGGDLHVHLSGAVYAESLIAWAERDGLCVRLSDTTIMEPPCNPEAGTPPLSAALRSQSTYDDIVNGLSMRAFVPSAAVPSGHDQFFAAFGKFGAATSRPDAAGSLQRLAAMTVNQLMHYGAEAVQYTELMVSFFSWAERRPLIEALTGQTDRTAMLETLRKNGIAEIVAEKRKQIADLIAQINALRNCDPENIKAGCNVEFRYIAQVSRNNPPDDIFVQTALAAELIRVEPWVVGLNFVGPEDYRVALRDYREHMQTIRFLAGSEPAVPVALHAGELWLGLVPPGDLTFHIREAAEIAGARRIGHGAGLAFERDAEGLLAAMRAKSIAVEINLTSNDAILGVRGKAHPLPTYLAAGVPVVLSTDDAGVSRINLTNEYFRAARDYGLGYCELKTVARNGLRYAFLTKDAGDKQRARLEAEFAQFESSVARGFFPVPDALKRIAVIPFCR